MTDNHEKATHRIENGKAVCDGGESSSCRWYPDCDCESWSEEHDRDHPRVKQDRCLQLDWLNATGLEDSYDGDPPPRWDDEDNVIEQWPDGLIETSWEYDYLLWSYAKPEEAKTNE